MSQTYEQLEWSEMVTFSRLIGMHPNDDDSKRFGNTTIDINKSGR